MGSLYRSEEMRFCQIIVERDAAFSAVAELGKLGSVQFKDLNPDVNSFQRMFVRDIRRFDELERKLRFLEGQINKDSIAIGGKCDDGDYTVLPTAELNQLEQTLTDLERDVKNMNDSDTMLRRNYEELQEWESVLVKTDEFFAGGLDDAAQEELYIQEDPDAQREKNPVEYVVGVIKRDRMMAFERVLWRACHHTAYVRSSDIEQSFVNATTGEKDQRAVFIIFYKGDRLKTIIDKVCDGFKAKVFKNCPQTSKDRQAAAADVRARNQDMQTVLGQTREHRFRVLQAAANNYNLWLKQVRLHKTVYHNLNLFTYDGIGRFFVAECWVPLADVDNVRDALERGVEKTGSSVKPVLNLLETNETPPTYNRTNKFTQVFQGIVDSYGIASYLELNPAPYTIITFPFLFSCMFGDLGHGILMALSGLWLVVREKALIARNIKDEIFTMFFGGRYIILLMGLFSIHAGILYNDVFAKSFNIFGTSWVNPYNYTEFTHWFENQEAQKKEDILIELNPDTAYRHDMGPYPFGVDPVWNLAENKLNFLNSMKMKLSVILGISQMTFGVLLSFQNYKFRNSKIDILTVFIPQIVFMSCIFIYLCLEIIMKWLFFWVRPGYVFGQYYPGSNCAPSLLIGLINMFMFKGRDAGFIDMSQKGPPGQPGKTHDACYLVQWYPGQGYVEAILVLIAVTCIPIMLFGKPIHFLLEQKKKKKEAAERISVRANVLSEEGEVVINGADHKGDHGDHQGGDHGGGDHHGENFGDVMVHQAIHSIEYVLGCVSHTASYLRLWALSLAHAQLSEVLWDMVFEKGFQMSDNRYIGSIAVYVIFFFFAGLTFSILVLMEGLSAFLHALRLHWVEFQSKFYQGLGYPFQPYSFKSALTLAENTSTSSSS
ncbi:unnamed protein product, partial [Mesorhabditis belari]|uniref:V-type proton ATPase subunit a n=1 Tax=Mesorhabditis belari TaxID=2138241 RepID=A0AAF3FG41_9BILA